jgi:hypothetical protein
MTLNTATATTDAIALTSSKRTQYESKYEDNAAALRTYDQFAEQIARPDFLGSSHQFNFVSHMTPGTEAISEIQDRTPQALREATASITPTSRGEVLQTSELQALMNFLNYMEMASVRVGQNAMETIELLASAVACAGANKYSYVARSSLDKDTSTHRASDSLFSMAQTITGQLGIPGWKDGNGGYVGACIMPLEAFHDIRESGNIDSIGLYQQAGIHLNFEVGKIGPYRIIASPWAKAFYAAGVPEGTYPIDTTASAAIEKGDTTFTTTATTNYANYASGWLSVGTEETGDTHQSTNERVRYSSISSSTVAIVGSGPNGGFKYDHAILTPVSNADSVYTMVFGGPMSMKHMYAASIGPYGQMVGPWRSGNLEQWINLAFKYYGNYGLTSEANLFRCEVSSSLDI